MSEYHLPEGKNPLDSENWIPVGLERFSDELNRLKESGKTDPEDFAKMTDRLIEESEVDDLDAMLSVSRSDERSTEGDEPVSRDDTERSTEGEPVGLPPIVFKKAEEIRPILEDEPDWYGQDMPAGEIISIDEAVQEVGEPQPNGQYLRSRQAAADPAGLTGMQRLFAVAYLRYLNPVRAYYWAGGRAKNIKNAQRAASALLAIPAVQDFIESRMQATDAMVERMGIDARGAAARLEMMALGSIEHFMQADGSVDLTSPQAQAHRDCIQSVKERYDKNGKILSTEVKLYDAKDAAKTLLSAAGAFSDKERDRANRKVKTREGPKLGFLDEDVVKEMQEVYYEDVTANGQHTSEDDSAS